MPVKVKIPTPLQKLTKNQAEIAVEATTIIELITALETDFPGMKERLCDDTGTVRRFVNIYVNGEDIRFLKGNDTALSDGDQISIIPAIAGGCN